MNKDFVEMDPISILAILKEFRDSCNIFGIYDGAAPWLFS